jgi:urease accessory protein
MPAGITTIIMTTMSRTTTITDPGQTDAPGLLRLLSWLSPAFPTGAFAFSHGLEWAVEAGDVSSAARLRDWLADLLAHGAARSDAILLRLAHRAAGDPPRLAGIAELAAAMAPARERQEETLAQGAAFLRAARPWLGGAWDGPEPLAYPLAVGVTAARHGIGEEAACVGFLQAFTANLISAAVRLVPLGQSDGLAVQQSLEPVLLAIAEGTRAAGEEDLGGCAFRADLAAMRHETQYTRLFRS